MGIQASKLEGHNIKECLLCRDARSPEAVGERTAVSQARAKRVMAVGVREELVRCTWHVAGIRGVAIQKRKQTQSWERPADQPWMAQAARTLPIRQKPKWG